MTGEPIRISGVAVITGGARGVGAAISQCLAARGAHVVVADLDEAAAEQTAASLRKYGYQATGIKIDVALETSIEAVADRAVSLGALTIWVNNAGISERTPLTEMTLAQWERVMAVNAGGVFLGTRAAARRMKAGGSIVNLASISSIVALPHLCHYGASKGAVATFTKHAAIDLAPRNIRVNAVAPATTRTAMTEARLAMPGQLEWTLDHIPLKRIAEPEDVARAVAFLCSQDAAFITGVLLPCDGGWTASA